MKSLFVAARLRGLAVVFLGLAGLSATAAPAVEPAPSPNVKKATWSQTMASTKAAYRRYMEEAAKGSGAVNAKPFLSDPIAGDGPGLKVSVNVAGWQRMRLVTTLEPGSGGNCHIWGDATLIAKDGTQTRLSTLRPVATVVGWGQLLTDQNWQNEPLKIGTKEFKHGIWVHADSDVCYLLNGQYERFEAWAGMDAARAVGAARFSVVHTGADPLPGIWKQLSADFPVQTKWLTDDCGRGRETQWLLDPGTRQIQGMVQHALGQVGPEGEMLRKQLGELAKPPKGADDLRWLDLYVAACRCRACATAIRQVAASDLRQLLCARLEQLVREQTPPEEPKWGELESQADRIAKSLGAAPGVNVATLTPSLENLVKALPDRIAGVQSLAARLAQDQQQWQAVIPALARDDEAAVAQLAAIRQRLKETRHALLASLRGMQEFLAIPANAAMEGEWESQFGALEHDLGNRAHFARVAKETLREDALILEADRDPADVVLRRAAALVADLKRLSAAPALAGLEKDLAGLQAANAAIDLKNTEARYVLYADACRLRRQIALCNPLLSFDKILFVKHHRALYDHMCDQFYGMAARPGGGLYVLTDPFGPSPQLRDVLANSVIDEGRLKGQRISGGPNIVTGLSFDGGGNVSGPAHEGGSFLSPDLSFDAKSVLFAYVECKGDQRHRHHTDPSQGHWAEGRCWHVFKVNLDGSHLQQLTDGTWNDFHPCWLPNGRVAFISERRGGYLRCGRVCPTYTLYDMAADGSAITCLSFHETNEWYPSVTHDGRILYTRWDYVDRHGCTAHLPWITTLDGRDSRGVHGNFAPRGSRPDMEINCRVVPNSPKFVATAAPHHGQAYGSLVLVNPEMPDDDAMAPVRRITPEVGFPESQGGAQVYATAWPLSEDYYLCVYDSAMQPGAGMQGGQYQPGNYGIYLVDSFGNKELIYRDPEIACLGPIPLRARPVPPVAPEVAKRRSDSDPAQRPAASAGAKEPEGTVAVINVYDSLKPWPAGTKIKELRVLQVLPMSVPSGGPPHETGYRVASAGDSVVPCRYVLGTVPVEADGSAHFVAPAHKEMFFQAIDQQGLAVQSMRSATYLHEGEHLVCIGCHEPKHRTPQQLKGPTPLALRREPSRLTPDVDGSNPFSYPRLVQPVLDKHCAECHQKNKDKAPLLGREPLVRNWYASYNSLASRFGFYNYGDAYRTTPGKFGAKASKLYELLEKGHYDVKLSPEDMHRLTLWLDCATMFYGVYEREGGQAQLRGEIARPTLE